ncbi:pyruvate dehydrogenase (acetyl-transferring) E1 component subunit alpha [Crocinitomicaceae bacterium CZZ-1]|uniref:Pyruvate dehydrogenase E1 component subunit alpha n=1 Tax=Taishania pollutisoli TaxID=2766479 RepID=A0A8J6P7J8_9FLAO|nr:pyruvate dehydrogenase (acetyl-transferring) E1 component subunit alpha [Taishania pollutisoli]MBC9813277.1 pyruvate dehydrogenase (acetyl-transferring) E1 component subunit alpha [Taishania pollutisoli]MBX2948952.1 pyruvate dehydrogenase (acetyl-transferring) E1 component subunit alpha [Crocinitomicaceae bacterium]NGF77003.1 pyruvate dehydrogenase (acetyl-transferring) E1 component subunit alpha [Fluviicola sp. SGL-29]
MAVKTSKKPTAATKKSKVDSTSKFSKETYIKWWKDMLLIRKFEEKTGQLYIQQKFGGFCHLYIGQEAIVAGTASACKPGDKHMTAYRDHAHPIALGTDPRVLMAELYGRTTGCSKGKGGSMHFFDKKVNFMGGHGIVGAQIAMGAGVAFAEKYNETGNVAFVSMGDGAVRQGALHETFNMAMMWKLPVVFIIENNNYAMGTSVERTTNVTDLSKIGLSYEMPSRIVNGMSPEAVHEAIEEAADRARRGDGPTLLDIRTYRYKGHSMSDPQKYRTKQEVEEWMDQDPIVHCLEVIKENKWMTDKEIKEVEDWVKKEVEESVEFAENSPYPEGKELYEDIYQEPNYPYIVEY